MWGIEIVKQFEKKFSLVENDYLPDNRDNNEIRHGISEYVCVRWTRFCFPFFSLLDIINYDKIMAKPFKKQNIKSIHIHCHWMGLFDMHLSFLRFIWSSLIIFAIQHQLRIFHNTLIYILFSCDISFLFHWMIFFLHFFFF